MASTLNKENEFAIAVEQGTFLQNKKHPNILANNRSINEEYNLNALCDLTFDTPGDRFLLLLLLFCFCVVFKLLNM